MGIQETYFYAVLQSGEETIGIRLDGDTPIDRRAARLMMAAHRTQLHPRPAGALAAKIFGVVPMPAVLAERLNQKPLANQKLAEMLRHVAWCKAFAAAATGLVPRRRRPARVILALAEPQQIGILAEAHAIKALREVRLEPHLDGRLVFTLPRDEFKRVEAITTLSSVFGVRLGRLRASAKDRVVLVERKRVEWTLNLPALTSRQKGMLQRLRWRLDKQVFAAGDHKGDSAAERFVRVKRAVAQRTQFRRDYHRLPPDELLRKWDPKTRQPMGRPKDAVRSEEGPGSREMADRVRKIVMQGGAWRRPKSAGQKWGG